MSAGTFALIFALVALALIVAYLILKPADQPASHTERRHTAGDRRRENAPVVYERRRGIVDRRIGPPVTLPAG